MKKVPNPPQKKPASLSELLEYAKREISILERTMAGYLTLSQVYHQMTTGVEDGERKLGVPQFRHSATVDGVNMVECVVDFTNVPEDTAVPAVAAFCNVHARNMAEAADNLAGATALMVKTIKAAFGAKQSKVAAAVVEQAPTGVDEEEEWEEPEEEVPHAAQAAAPTVHEEDDEPQEDETPPPRFRRRTARG